MAVLYKGFSTYNYQRTGNFSVTDAQVVNQDLMNHIYTRRGTRVRMPTFGTRIPDLVFEPLDDITINMIVEDLHSVIAFDPRVKLVALNTVPMFDENAIYVDVRLLYVELNMVSTLSLNILFEG